MPARYVFHVRFCLEPTTVTLHPQSFETTMYRAAGYPGEGDDWLFFRDNLWRGELADPEHFRALTEDALGVPVESVEYRRFEVDADHYDAFTDAIAADLEPFRDDSVAAVLNKYLGSSVEVDATEE